MKRFIAVLLSSLILCLAAACSSSGVTTAQSSSESQSVTAGSGSAENSVSQESPAVDDLFSASGDVSEEEHDMKTAIGEILDKNKFEGVLYAEKGGEAVFSDSRGNLENGDPIMPDTSMPVGSVSKQFCACAILSLVEKGKLSLDDTLDKYYPEFEKGKKMTLKNVLSMRAGLADIDESIYKIVSVDKTEEENTEAVKKWIFEQDVLCEPDTEFHYSNAGFFLLGNIVEQVSGQKYIDYLRENFFAPIGMEHTGNIDEMNASAEWAGGVIFKNIDAQPGLTKGAGDIISNGEDMGKWLKALSQGKVISEESYKAMIEDYSSGEGYGYGIRSPFFGGVGHPGQIGTYVSMDYVNTDEDVIMFFSSSNLGVGSLTPFASSILNEIRS